MQASSIPTKMPVVWGANAGAGYIRPIPVNSQIGVNPGYASYTDGFPPLNFVNPNAGGVPPWGQDVNGIFNAVTSWLQWEQAGGPVNYDASFSTSIGGYPAYAMVASTSVPGAWWQSQVDNNTTNPDTGGANWILCTMQQPYLDARYLRVTATNTFYVNGTTGNDNFNGQSPTVGTGNTGPFKTISGAVRKISGTYSFSTVTVNVAAGAYSGFAVSSSLIANWSFVGSGTGSCSITAVFNDATAGFAVNVSGGAQVSISGFSVAGYQCGIAVQNGSNVTIGTVAFGSCTLLGCISIYRGSFVNLSPQVYGTTSSITTTGTSAWLLGAQVGSQIQVGYTEPGKSAPNTLNVNIALSGTFTTATVYSNTGSLVELSPANITWSGTPTGPKFLLGNAEINTAGSGLSYIPGSTAGTMLAAMTTSGTSAAPTARGIYA